jgi:uncharacterized membrane protein (UPF0127 family)
VKFCVYSWFSLQIVSILLAEALYLDYPSNQSIENFTEVSPVSIKKKHHKRNNSRKPSSTTPRFIFIGAVLTLSATAAYYVISRPKTVEIGIGETRVKVEIADTPELRSKGLSNRKRLKSGRGMLFVFDFSRRQSFWMKDTPIPLSIAFISSDGTIRQIEQMTPFDLNKTPSHSPAQYALEVNQGFFKENGISVGMQVDLSNVTDQ